MSEIPLQLYYERSKKIVGRARNGAYVPHLIQKHLAYSVQREHNVQLPPELIADAIYDIPINLYSDVQGFFEQLAADSSIVPVIFTQGEVGVNGFQNWKVEKSRIGEYINPQALQILNDHNLPFIYGGYDKCTFEVVEPIISFLEATNMQQTIYIDDSVQNVSRIVELFHDFRKPIQGYWLNRDNEPVTASFEPMSVVHSLSEIDISSVRNALAMIDYDGTLVDRKAMRNALKNNVISSIEEYLKNI